MVNLIKKFKQIIFIIVIVNILFVASSFSSDREHQLFLNNHTNIVIPIKSWIEIKNKDLVRQEFDYSCGSGALATILTYFMNEKISENEILNFVLNKKGINKQDHKDMEHKDFTLSFYDLKEFVQTKGYKAIGMTVNIETLKHIKVPAILYVKVRKNDHFTVYKGMNEQFVYLADPSYGNTKVRFSKFEEMFYVKDKEGQIGKILVIIPEGKDRKNTINKEFMDIPEDSGFVYKAIGQKARK